MKSTSFPARLALTSAIVAALTACGGSKDPDIQDAPVPEVTAAEINGSVIKGAFSGAIIAPTMVNETHLNVVGDVQSMENGDINTLSLTTEPGFGINGLMQLAAESVADSSMVCDAPMCGGKALGDILLSADLGDAVLKTLHWLKTPYANPAGGDIEASLQVSALTTFASALIEQGILAGKNISSKEIFDEYQVDRSRRLLQILGINLPNYNVFSQTLASAENADSLAGLDEWQQKLSLVNAAFAQFAENSTLSAFLSEVINNLLLADAEDDLAAAQVVRQHLLDVLQAHPVAQSLNLVASDIIDFKLPLVTDTVTLEALFNASRMEGAVVTARKSINGNEHHTKVFDGSVDTKWLDDGGTPSVANPSWVQVEYQAPVAITTLTITSANDADERDPENFTIQGSSNGENWVTLAAFSGVAFDDRFQTQQFPFNNLLPFKSYRINITKNRGNSKDTQIAEIELFAAVHPGVNHSSAPVADAITARASISENENHNQVFDGSAASKWLDNGGVPTVKSPSWLAVALDAPKAVRHLAITSANDAPERDPENMVLKGSHDGGVTWVIVGQVQGAVFDDRFERQVFDLGNELAFSSYRFEVTKNFGNGKDTQIAEIELIGPEVAATNKASQAGVAIKGRKSIHDGENTDKAFDGDVMTKWLDDGGVPTVAKPSWVEVQLPEAQVVNMLALTTPNDNAPSRDPENISLQGSSDGKTWQNLMKVDGINFNAAFGRERQTFKFPNALAYEWYRLNTTKNAGDDSMTQLAEIELIGPQYAAEDKSDMNLKISARDFFNDNESPEKAFDNNLTTKWLDDSGMPSVESPSWIQVELAQPEAVTVLAITSGGDAKDRDPENFALKGSKDGENWVEVASWSGEVFDGRTERRTFPFINVEKYGFYRLDITKNHGDDRMTQIGEIELIGY